MLILILFLAFFYFVGRLNSRKKEVTFRDVERDIFIAQVIAGKRKL